MKLYNTLTRKKEEFLPLSQGEIKMYICGPTVYNYIHMGNARPMCVFDVLRRYFEYRGYKVTYVQNFTDIDDKLIRRANEEGATVPEIAEKYIKEYKIDATGLNVREATIHPRATENIQGILNMIQTLMEKGFAYESNGDVYFRTRKDPDYGKLSHMPIEELESGARVNIGEQKEDPLDFALWKAAKPGEPFWTSPWGNGRPGWHIECSAMNKGILGDTIDIHCGGQDLIFPHHENEIAQSECANGKPFARYWLHNGFLTIDKVKMSKSLGNFFTTREVAEKYGYEPIRFLMIAAHYRSPINYSVESILQAKASLERLYTCRDNLDFALSQAGDIPLPQEGDASKTFAAREQQFIDAMDDDMNTADAIAALFDLVRDLNNLIGGVNSGTAIPSKSVIEQGIQVFDQLTGVLGLVYNRKTNDMDAQVEALIEARQAARKAKDFAKADSIRDQLKEMGIQLEDTKQGIKWKRI